MIMATDNKNKVLNVPNLRFPEFTEEWRKYKVSDVLDFYSTNSLSWEQLDYDNEDLYNLHYGLIHVGLPILVDIGQNKLPGIKTECKPKNFELCKEGDVAFADASEDTNDVAKAIEFVNLNNHKTVCGLHTIHGRDNKHLTVLGYKGYAFASPLFHNQIRRIAQGTKIYSISSKNFTECYIGIPSKDEQSKIARLLALIDSRIATQNKIIEDLKKLKVAIRDKAIALGIKKSVFKTLDSIADIYQPQTIPTSLLSEDAEYFVYGANGIIGKYTEYNHSESQICIACRGNTCGTINFSTAKSWITGNAMVVNTDQYSVINKRYLYHYLSTINFNPLISGSGQPQIVRQPLAKLKIPTPSIEQQVGIVKVIDSFELKIEIEKKYLQSLLTQKVYLLSNMFI